MMSILKKFFLDKYLNFGAFALAILSLRLDYPKRLYVLFYKVVSSGFFLLRDLPYVLTIALPKKKNRFN
jgi:hypothetical protein